LTAANPRVSSFPL